MNIEDKINADIKASMIAKNAKRLEAIRAIKSVILLLKTSPEGFTEETAIKAIQKEHKKRKETAEIYLSQNRQDLANDELAQALILEEYLPKALSENELKQIIADTLKQLNISSTVDIGKAIGAVNKVVTGRADGKLIAQLIKEQLS